MSSVTAKALLQFEQSGCLQKQKYVLHESDLESLAIKDQSNTITDPASCSRNVSFKAIQDLDARLYSHVTNQDYDNALKSALEMEALMPEAYYGYQRVAQIHLIREEYADVFQAYHRGFENIPYGDGIELLLKSVEDTQHILDQAAVEFANTNQFDKASRIARQVITLLPKSPTGYVRTARLCEMQGKFKEAMDSYDQGISSVPVDHHALLIQHKINLQKRINRKPQYDFIEQMPLEITSKIAQYLAVDDLIECLKVSKSWKNRIEHCPEAWRVLTVKYNGGNIDMNAIQNVKRFVQQVILIYASGNMPLLESLLTSMGEGEFDNLTYLDVDQDTMSPECIPYLANIFDRINLTRLGLVFGRNMMPDSYIPLHQILRSCPHLERLTYHTMSYASDIKHKLLPEEPTRITHLSIGAFSYFKEKVEKSHFFIPLLPSFPHLVNLRITYSSPGDLQIITKECPNLRRLAVVMQNAYKEIQAYSDSGSAPKGLQYLQVDACIDPKDVAGVIAQNSKTLLSVDITLFEEEEWDDRSVDADLDWKQIPKLDCPVLRKLHFRIEYHWPFEQWIRNCPALEEVTLKRATELTDSIFDNLIKLPNLRELCLEDCSNLTDAGLSRFFNDLQKQGSKLHTVIIKFCDSLSTHSLVSLAALPSLRNLFIYKCRGITESVFQDFATKIDGGSGIVCLTLLNLNGVTDRPLLQLIHALPNLAWLNLSFLQNITDATVFAIADAWFRISLLQLNIYQCRQISPWAIANAENVKITQEYFDV
ncbi:hypothetical protein BJV82DRAFT_597933 [Fennellomyces sp. T-0311]|nr:hypothetical protein BJV82DRAFT_597933 [Fennellomyces sp. T-0311]